MKIYEHKKIEKKWQKNWTTKKTFKTQDGSGKKCFVLDMFPYPSGDGLHVGHPKGYIATDIYSRYKRMNGYNVLHPMGFDAFGLPAENYAIKNKMNPADAIKKNVKRFRSQLEIIGLDYDWSRTVVTTDPEYYHWTQWAFLQMFKKGLAYESYEPINWCPSCKTGLANEDLDGSKCERCGTEIEKKPMRQWVIKITKYADRLLNDLDALNWPEAIKESQRNWIGRSEGSELSFNIINSEEKIKVFTTRPDTLFGVTYVVLAPENELVNKLKAQIKNWSEVEKYISTVKSKSEIDRTAENKEKTGVQLIGVEAKHPITKQHIPVFIADYVLANYGTGSVMAVPAHDDRDFAFAKKYNLPIKEVIMPERVDKRNPPITGKKTVERENVHVIVKNPKDNKILCLQWKKHDWRTFPMGGVDGDSVLDAARREVLEETGYKNLSNGKVLGGQVRAEYFAAHKDVNRVSNTHLVCFDLVNEDRIDITKDEADQADVFWADMKDLTVDFMTHAEMDIWLDRINNGVSAYTGDGILINSGEFTGKRNREVMSSITEYAGGETKVTYRLKDWVFSRQRYWGEPIPVIHCEKCGVVAVPEKDLPVVLPKVKFYEPTGTGESPLATISKWVNVKCPTCKGKAKRETNTMPQWAGSSWYYLRYIDPKNKKALVDKKKEKKWSPVDMYVGGTEHATRHLIYARFWHKFLFDIGVVNFKEPFTQLKNQGMILGSDNRKMSKRWGNVVNPDDVVRDFGADTLRVYEMFMGPFSQEASWSTDNMVGSRRFIERIWKLQNNITKNKKEISNKVEFVINRTVKKVTEDISDFNFNTAISAMMILTNDLANEKISQKHYEAILKIFAPFAPHVSEELWNSLGYKKSIHLDKWPKYDPSKIESDEIKIGIQVNGKVRAELAVDKTAEQSLIEKTALNMPEVKKWLVGVSVKKIIYIKGRVLNIVVV